MRAPYPAPWSLSAHAMTDWFDGTVKPVRKGYYQRQYDDPNCTWPDKWDGERWQLCNPRGTVVGPAREPMPWRGLASDPAKAGK